MPAKSTKQQRLMGMVHATQTGQIKNPSEKVAKLAKSMTKKSASDYASTKHKGLPKKVKKKSIKENMDYENKVGQLHMVQKPSAGCDVAGMVYQIDPISGIQQHGVDAQTVHGVYSTPEEAQKVAEKLYNEHMTGMKKLEEKKGTVANKLNKAITMLEKKHKGLMETAKENPAQASSHKAAIAEIQSKIQELMDKLELVEKSKKPIESKKDEKKTLKENIGGNLDTLKKLLDTHDWYYSSADDHMAYIAGQKEFDTIVKLAIANGDEGINLLADKFKEKFKVPDKNMEDVKKSFKNYFKNTTVNENKDGESFQTKLKKFIDDNFKGEDIKIESPGKKSAVIVYEEGEMMPSTIYKKFEKAFDIFEPSAEYQRDGQWYYTVNNKSMSEAFEPDYGSIEALGNQVEDALFDYIGAFDYELGDDEQIKEDVAVLVDKIVDKYINSAYSH